MSATSSDEPGTVLALPGPDGAGNTTLVRILTTLLEPNGRRAGGTNWSPGGENVPRAG